MSLEPQNKMDQKSQENRNQPAQCEAQLDAEIFQLLAEADPCTNYQSFEDIIDYIDQRSITYRMFRNEFAAPPKNKRHHKPAPNHLSMSKMDSSVAIYYVPVPANRSKFTTAEMRDLYAVFSATEAKTPSQSQIITYSECLEKLKEENHDYLGVVKQRWIEDQWMRTSVLKDSVTEYVSNWWKNRMPRVRNYPKTYKQVSSISLSPSEHQVKLLFLKNLRSDGKSPIYWSHLKKQVTRPTYAPAVLKEMTGHEKTYSQHTSTSYKEVSHDEVAERLALDNQVQLVLTPSTIATLLANNPSTFEECWCIPFVVKEYTIVGKKDAPGEQTRKIIYLDKKLPPQSLTPPQKNLIYAKHAVRAVYLRKPKYWDMRIKEEPDMEEECDASGDEMYNPDEKPDGDVPEAFSRFFLKQICYNLWECSAADPAAILSKHHKKPFKILVRTPIRGQIPLPKKSGDPDHLKLSSYCTLLPKLDYQPEYGAMVASFSEISKEWTHAMLRPNSVLHRVRIDPVSGSTIMIESKSAVELANDCQRIHSRNMQNQLSILQNLFDALGHLPPGNYLLNHKAKDLGFMFVHQEQTNSSPNSKATMNLWGLYEAVDTAATTASPSAPWVPLDAGIITPTFHRLERIPCVFAPRKHEKAKKKPENMPPQLHERKKSKKSKNKRLTMGKKGGGPADSAAALNASKFRKRLPYHDVDSVTNEY